MQANSDDAVEQVGSTVFGVGWQRCPERSCDESEGLMSAENHEIGLDIGERFQQPTRPPDHRSQIDGLELQRQLAPIMVFLGAEIARSSSMLGELANSLSQQLQALAANTDQARILPNILKATEALQKEDRIQQRLGDIRAILTHLEHALQADLPATDLQLHQSIAGALRLEEMQSAFAADADGACLDQRASPKKEPRAGDVDLF